MHPHLRQVVGAPGLLLVLAAVLLLVAAVVGQLLLPLRASCAGSTHTWC
jgi:hypothetical protein